MHAKGARAGTSCECGPAYMPCLTTSRARFRRDESMQAQGVRAMRRPCQVCVASWQQATTYAWQCGTSCSSWWSTTTSAPSRSTPATTGLDLLLRQCSSPSFRLVPSESCMALQVSPRCARQPGSHAHGDTASKRVPGPRALARQVSLVTGQLHAETHRGRSDHGAAHDRLHGNVQRDRVGPNRPGRRQAASHEAL